MPITIESPLKLRKRIGALRSPALGEWVQGLQVGAKESLQTLTSLQGNTAPLQLVEFYQIVSPWCDLGSELRKLNHQLSQVDYGQFDKARKALKALAAQDERDIYGVNRTYSGERPTAENIFLGERVCLSTETVSYWERIRGNLGGKPALLGVSNSPATISEVIDNQALELLTSGLNRWKPLFQALIDA